MPAGKITDGFNEHQKDAEAFLRGERSALRAAHAAIKKAVNCFRLSDTDIRRDLIQDSITRLFVGLSSGRFRGESSLVTYAQNIAKYACLEYLRHKRAEARACKEPAPPQATDPGPEALVLDAEGHKLNMLALSSLPAEIREMLRLIFVEEMSYREVAAFLGLSEGAVKSRVHRCRQLLRQATSTTTKPEGRRPVLSRGRAAGRTQV